MADRPIVIAGGGIGGFGTALALAKKGRPVHLLEQADEFAEVGAGIQLGPNVWKMFEQLGLTEAMSEYAVFPDEMVAIDALSGERIFSAPLGDAIVEANGYPYGVIYRPDLHNVLIEACRTQPNVTLTTGQQVVDFEDTGEMVRVSTASGESHEGSALIGADGLWSNIREKLVGDGKPRVSGHIAYRAVIPTPEVPDENRVNKVVLWAGPKTHLVHYPLHKWEKFNLVVVFHSDRYEEGWDVYGDPDELWSRFEGQVPEVIHMLEQADTFRMWVLCDRDPVRDWSKGRVALLGDAAHPMLQYLAQGACMAMEDGVCLANRLDEHDDVETALEAYWKARYMRTARVQLYARLMGDFYHASGASRDLRNYLVSGGMGGGGGRGVMTWLYQDVDETGAQIL